MLVSLNEIKKYMSLDGFSVEDIANGLTFAGIEVEEISTKASGTNLIIGEVLECVAHPDSDHLHVLQVNLGEKYGVTQIVCGAPNARKGIKVIVARVGAKLPKIEIKKGIIRGQESNGMCCSLLELGVDSKYLKEEQINGIEELPADAPVGEEEVLKYLGLDDVVFNLNVLANRPDLLSVFNVIKEIGAILNVKYQLPTSFDVKETFKSELKVGSDTDKCSQFSGREIKNIVIKDSPAFMKAALESMGVRSINNIVDIGNYVMLMTGQPLHMYDADKLQALTLEARSDYEGDFVALDEKTYKVQQGDIVICCNKKPMCLGGVMGSLECAVDEKSTHIVIEAASFDGASIRRTSNRLGLASESSSRFVKGTNHFQADFVLDVATDLILKYCDGKEVSDIKEYQSEQYVTKEISTSIAKINNRLGTEFTFDEIKDVLTRLNFGIKGSGEDFKVLVPAYRLDVTCDADISEEVIRLLGYSHVKSVLPCLDVQVGALSLEQERLKDIREYLLNRGLDECLTYSLVSEKEYKLFNLLNNEEPYVLLNPLTDEHSHFRTHILHSLLEVATYNIARQAKSLALFETSHVQSKESRSDHLAIVLVGSALTRGNMEKVNYDFFHMKGLVDGIMELLGIEQSRYKFERLSDHLDELHPGKSAGLYFQNKLIGVLGELHPLKVNEYDLGKNPVVVMELKLDELLSSKVSVTKMKPIPRFPSMSRDLAFVVNKSVAVKDIIKTIRVTGKGIATNAEVFDVYEGEHIESGKKSVAISITYQKEETTLTEKEVSDVEDKIKFELLKTYHAELRG